MTKGETVTDTGDVDVDLVLVTGVVTDVTPVLVTDVVDDSTAVVLFDVVVLVGMKLQAGDINIKIKRKTAIASSLFFII